MSGRIFTSVNGAILTDCSFLAEPLAELRVHFKGFKVGNYIDLAGQKFNRLTVISRGANSVENTVQFLCKCDCGKECLVRSSFLKNSHTKSCGCYHSEIASENGKKELRHGHCSGGNSSTYQIWANMWYRCTSPKQRGYERYGGRGIAVCERWESFDNFLADMGVRPAGLSIDRIDNDGNYEPSNCRWATRKQQSSNRQNTVTLTIDGITKPLNEWAAIHGKKAYNVYLRLKLGWDAERALTQPLRRC